MLSSSEIENLTVMADALRVLAVDMVEEAKSGHPGAPLGMADIFAVLHAKFLKFSTIDPKWQGRDRLVLSNGHASALLYALYYYLGYEDVSLDELKKFRQLGSKAAGHPEYGEFLATETTTGPLGQGLTNAVGMAIAAKKHHNQKNRDLGLGCDSADGIDHDSDSSFSPSSISTSFDIDSDSDDLKSLLNLQDEQKIYCMVGDGCLMEGISQEAISLAGHLGLNNLIVIHDDNSISIDGRTDLSVSDDTAQRFRASKWEVIEGVDGHDYQRISDALATANLQADLHTKPILIQMKTIIGYKAPNKADSAAVHGSPLGDSELRALKLAIPEYADHADEKFVISQKALELWRGVAKFNNQKYQRYLAILGERDKGYAQALSLELKKLDARLESRLKKQTEILDSAGFIEQSAATRKLSASVIAEFAESDLIVGGSADLSGSNCTIDKKHQAITKNNFAGNYLYYGVREQAMAAIMNGIVLSGLKAYGGTFLIFSDYMRPAIRLSALMQLPVIYVMTHDSIGLGEDGPTHQPVEHLEALRQIPNLRVLRPCDELETVISWRLALQNQDQPTILALSRQDVRIKRLSPKKTCSSSLDIETQIMRYGASVIATYGSNNAELTERASIEIYATGSEVMLAQDVASRLIESGYEGKIVVVSVLDLVQLLRVEEEFKFQVLSYKHRENDAATSVDNRGKNNSKSLQIAIEAGVEGLWSKLLGREGLFFGLRDFGASGKYQDLYQKFGLDVDNIAKQILRKVAQTG